ncbi:RNA-directed DNA polymerase from mobile element jockey [Trichonephila clavipes]|nr:RNA-directed DNA polymerase from mobile element jockey [Trichonephila clavipes]
MDLHPSDDDVLMDFLLDPSTSTTGKEATRIRCSRDFSKKCYIAKVTLRVRGYNCVRWNAKRNASSTGGGCLFKSHLYPSNVVTLHTSAEEIQIHSLVTVYCIYLSPNDVVSQVDLNQLVSQLPSPFILLGGFNEHSLLWGHDDSNSHACSIKMRRAAVDQWSRYRIMASMS